MSLWCWLFGHKFNYSELKNFKSDDIKNSINKELNIYTKRKCLRCNYLEKSRYVFENFYGSPRVRWERCKEIGEDDLGNQALPKSEDKK